LSYFPSQNAIFKSILTRLTNTLVSNLSSQMVGGGSGWPVAIKA